MADREFITVTEATQLAPFSRRKMQQLVKVASWASRPDGIGKWIIDKKEFEAWLKGESPLSTPKPRRETAPTSAKSKSTADASPRDALIENTYDEACRGTCQNGSR